MQIQRDKLNINNLYLSVYEAVHFRWMKFGVVERVVDFHVVVLVAYQDYIRLNFDLIFAPPVIAVSLNCLQPAGTQRLRPIGNAADAAVVRVILLFFVRIVFAVYYCYPYWRLNHGAMSYVAVNRANWFVN